jgi:predicted transposase YbfD/YdcC
MIIVSQHACTRKYFIRNAMRLKPRKTGIQNGDGDMVAMSMEAFEQSRFESENSLHWVLDDYFREDRCTARAGHATENLALMRKLVFNLSALLASVRCARFVFMRLP